MVICKPDLKYLPSREVLLVVCVRLKRKIKFKCLHEGNSACVKVLSCRLSIDHYSYWKLAQTGVVCYS